MKWTLQIFLLAAVIGNAQAQPNIKTGADGISGNAPINIASDQVNKLFVAPPEKPNRLKSASAVETKIDVTYIGFPAEAQQAFEYAVSIWGNLITTSLPVKITAKWEKLEGNVLALSRPATFHVNFDGAPISNVYYPVALAEKLSGKEINNNQPDIICSFNKSFSWYFGTDGNTPVNQYDFVSSVLHEITHGLGVSGFLKGNDGTGYFDNCNNLPSIYDYYIFNTNNQQISDKSLFNSPSKDLHEQLTSDELQFSRLQTQNNTIPVDYVYAPAIWREGASIYHTKGVGYDYGLMTPFAHKGEAIHNPGENVMKILAELGWKSVTFKFDEIKDFESPEEIVPVQISMLSDLDIDSSSVKVIYSNDYFTTHNNTQLNFNTQTNHFEGNIALGNQMGNVQYYFTAKSIDGRTFNWPAQAPLKKFALRVGPDYSKPELLHNPVGICRSNNPQLNLNVVANDNIGINSVKIEYKVNGVLQEPVVLESQSSTRYNGVVELPENLNINSLEYSITATDQSINGNVEILPTEGFYNVQMVNFLEPVSEFSTNFDDFENNFVLAGFTISGNAGFKSNVLHTTAPYTTSALENEKINLIAQLAYPVIIQEGGVMTFDEVVLVEPGENEAAYTDELFWDYVIVEASKNNGNCWLPLTDGYDSGVDELWYNEFTSNLKSNISAATGTEEMFLKQRIELNQHPELSAGDTILIRFRLASDHSVNGWGWAIDNLEIQKEMAIAETGPQVESEVSVFPNPFQNSFYVDCSAANDLPSVDIEVTDLYGKTVFRNANVNPTFDNRVQVDLSASSAGIYLVHVRHGNSIISTNKLVKN